MISPPLRTVGKNAYDQHAPTQCGAQSEFPPPPGTKNQTHSADWATLPVQDVRAMAGIAEQTSKKSRMQRSIKGNQSSLERPLAAWIEMLSAR